MFSKNIVRFAAPSLWLKIFSDQTISHFIKSHYLINAFSFPHIKLRFCSNEITPTENVNSLSNRSVLEPAPEIDLTDYGSMVLPNATFAMYADKSPLIQKLLSLRVNLYRIQKNIHEAQFLVTLRVEQIEPYLCFLTENGVAQDKLGRVITMNPLLFKESLDNLQVRINYLSSKKFSKTMITNIIEKNPKWLSISVKDIDEKLGFLQQNLKLSGDELRQIITKAPGLVMRKNKHIITNIFFFKEEMGFDFASLKKIVLGEPTVLKKQPKDLVLTYEFLTKVMKVSKDLILKQPTIFTTRSFILNERHKFLEYLGRAQYNPSLPQYINLMDLVKTDDEQFCNSIAKTSLKVFYNFLKTL